MPTTSQQIIDEAPSSAYPATVPRLKTGHLSFFRTIAESVGVQGPTGGVVISAAILAGISGGGTALVQVIAAIAMAFVAYAFILFTREFNSSGSVYGFTGAAVGPGFGFLSAWALMLVYVNFAGGVYASVADEATPAFAAIGLHLPWPVWALIAFAGVMILAYLDIRISSVVVLALEGASMLLVTIVSVIILAKGGYHGHAFSAAPFQTHGAPLAVLGLGIVYAFSAFSGFEAAATLGEESARPRRLIPWSIALSLAVVALYEIGVAAVVTNAFPSIKALAGSAVPLVAVTDRMVAPWVGTLINFGAVLSSFGAALASANGASRILYALSRDGFGPRLLTCVSARTGSPVGAVAVVGAVSVGFLVGFLRGSATQAVAVILTYGADLILAAYTLVLIAAILFTVKRHASWWRTAILLVGLGVMLSVMRETFIPFPEAPYNWDAYGAMATLALGVGLPGLSPRLRRGIRQSPLLRVGTATLEQIGMADRKRRAPVADR